MAGAGPSKIVCIGRNYVAHARELGNDVPARPLIFLKPPSSLIGSGEAIELPPDSRRVEHEAEIGLRIGRRVRHVSEAEALSVIDAVLPINDVTARDLQAEDVQFTRGKSFDTFCPVGTGAALPRDWRSIEVEGRVNGTVRQRGSAAQMVFGIPSLIAFVSRIMTLEPGDLIATGTPEGVGPLIEGDQVEIELVGMDTLINPVRAARV